MAGIGDILGQMQPDAPVDGPVSEQAAPMAAPPSAPFDPEGTDYDYQSATKYGLGAGGDGHWGSVAELSPDDPLSAGVPSGSYLMLKGRNHETWDRAVAAEQARGSSIIKVGGRYYSVPAPAPDPTSDLGALISQFRKSLDQALPPVQRQRTQFPVGGESLTQGPLVDTREQLTQGPDKSVDAYAGGWLGKLLATGLSGLLGGPSREDVLGPSILKQESDWLEQNKAVPFAERGFSPIAQNLGMNAGAIKGFHGSPTPNLPRVMATPVTRQFDNATSQFGAFISPTEEGAKRYATGPHGKVYSVTAPIERPFEMKWSEFGKFQAPNKAADGSLLPASQWGARAEELKREAAMLRTKLMREGYDGLVVKNANGESVEIASFNDIPVKAGKGG